MDFKLTTQTNSYKPEDKIYDLIIVGLGPAGYTAGIYATRFKLDVLMVGEEQGGLASETPEIENYPGYEKISGADLMEKMKSQYLTLGGNVYETSIVEIEKKDIFYLTTAKNEKLKAKSIILATGTKRRKLNVPGEDKFLGRGVSYCATCDAPFFKGKTVAVVGGGDAAFTSALHLSHFASKVYIIHRRDEFRAQPALVDKLKNKVEFILNKQVIEIEGKLKVENLKLKDTKTNEISELNVDGIFIEIGYIPTKTLVSTLGIDTDERGFIKVNNAMETNIKGIFAAGDCTNGLNNVKQIITACGMGAVAAESAYKYLQNIR